MPHEGAQALKRKVGFFQAVKVAMVKTSAGEGRRSGELELAIKQVIDESIVSEGR